VGDAPYPSLVIALGDALDASRSHRGGVMPAIVTDRHKGSWIGSCVWSYSTPPTSRPSPTWPSVSHYVASLALPGRRPREGLDGRAGLGWETEAGLRVLGVYRPAS
jgi:hypothetical protein